MARERVKPVSTWRDTDYEKAIKVRYKDFKDGYNKAVEKACEWLNVQLYTDDGGSLTSERYQDLGEFIESFRKAMEGQSMDKSKPFQWVKCTEANYWPEDSETVTLVRVTMDGEQCVFTRYSCPYGWNVLCKMSAEMMDVPL